MTDHIHTTRALHTVGEDRTKGGSYSGGSGNGSNRCLGAKRFIESLGIVGTGDNPIPLPREYPWGTYSRGSGSWGRPLITGFPQSTEGT